MSFSYKIHKPRVLTDSRRLQHDQINVMSLQSCWNRLLQLDHTVAMITPWPPASPHFTLVLPSSTILFPSLQNTAPSNLHMALPYTSFKLLIKQHFIIDIYPNHAIKNGEGLSSFSTLVLLLHFSYVSLSFPHRPASMTGMKLGILPIAHICRCNSTGVYLSFPILSHTAIVNYNLLVKIPFTKPGDEVGRL